jgi:hypothetical protein
LGVTSPPLKYTGKHQADVPWFIQSAFMLLRPGAVVHIEHECSERRLRVRTILLTDDRLGVRLEFPDSELTNGHELSVRARLAAAGFACTTAAACDPMWPAQDRPRFIVNNLSAPDAFRAVEAAREGLGLDQGAAFTMWLEGIPSFAAVRKYARNR